MAYFSKEDKAKVAPLIKSVLKKYGVKGSIKVDHHTSLVVNIKSGKLDFIAADKKIQANSRREPRIVQERTYLQVNEYYAAEWHRDVGEEKIASFYDELLKAMRGAGWYNNSDAQVDYFDTAYYMHVNVGKWNKPYVLE